MEDSSMQNQEFAKTIKLLNDSNCLRDVILIGSWAEYIYQQTGIIPAGTTSLQTLDIDFLIKNLNKPNPPINLETLAREHGYAVDKDVLLGTTKIRTTSRLEIEFLIAQKGKGIEPVYRTALGVTAQGLRDLDILAKNTIEVEYFGMIINVPTPEAYVVHKILINDSRRKAKKQKDREHIKLLLPMLDSEKLDELISKSTKKEKRIIDAYLESV